MDFKKLWYQLRRHVKGMSLYNNTAQETLIFMLDMEDKELRLSETSETGDDH